jgi:DNA-binding NtrC family response regulator
VSPPRVLVVDDKENMLKLFARILADGWRLTTASDGTHALALLASEEFDVVVTDIRMPGASGFEVLRAAKARSPSTEVVMMTGYGTVADAVQAMKDGAYDYLEKPFDPDEAGRVVARAAERKRLVDEASSLRRQLQGVYAFENLIGKSARMREAFALLEQAAGLDIWVLLLGATGSG